jgi:quercetin dioxygenase-like cupin family protein
VTRVLIAAAMALGAAAAAPPFEGRAHGAVGPTGTEQQAPPGMTRTVLVDNATVLVVRLGYDAGKGETSHTHPFSAVVLQLTPGDVDMTLNTDRSRARREAGTAWFIPAGAPHAAVNAGTAPFEQIAITIKPTRPAAPAAPPSDAPAGIARTTLVDNADTRVVRVQFAAGAREPVHSHPNDLLTVQLTAGRMDMRIGSETIAGQREPGAVQFLPRDVPHAYASTDAGPFELVSVAIK